MGGRLVINKTCKFGVLDVPGGKVLCIVQCTLGCGDTAFVPMFRKRRRR